MSPISEQDQTLIPNEGQRTGINFKDGTLRVPSIVGEGMTEGKAGADEA